MIRGGPLPFRPPQAAPPTLTLPRLLGREWEGAERREWEGAERAQCKSAQ
jgi:hypothetical protein